MFIRFYRANLPFQQLFLIPVLGILLWLDVFINPISPVESQFNMPLYSIVFNMLHDFALLNSIIAFLLLLIQAFILNNTMRISGFVSKNSLFPALIYVIFISADSKLLSLNPVLIANLFIIIAVDLIFKIYAQEQPYSKILNAGIYISIASLFYLPTIFIGTFLWMSFIIYRQIAWRNFIVSTIGLITPYVFVVFYFFWFDKLNEMSNVFFAFFKTINSFIIDLSIFDIISASLIALLFLLSMKSLINNINKRVIKIRKHFYVTLWLLLVSFATIFYSGELFLHHFLICIIPISVILVNYFEIIKKIFWVEILFSLLIVSIFLERFF